MLAADLDHGTFSDDPPWLVDPDEMPWREGIAGVRRHTRRQVPLLLRRRRVPPSDRLLVTLRHLGGALLAFRLHRRRLADRSARRADLSHRFRLAMEELGPTYIKLAQILSAGEGLFPDELVTEM